MRNALSAINSWLKANKLEVPDEMIQSINVVSGTSNITLGFAYENELANFTMRVLSGASAVKVEDYYMAKIDWKKRAIVFILKVIPNMPRAVDQVFSDSTDR